MENVFSYLKKYSNTGFLEKEFNEIDAAIFSLISYLDFDPMLMGKETSLKVCIEDFLKNGDIKEFLSHGFVQKELVKLAKTLKNNFRYKDVLVSNYVYKVDSHEQFCALTFMLPSGEKVISFEGTNHELVGWREDFEMIYKFPVDGDRDAIKYLNKNISLFDKNVYVVGHSKGGHFALVAAMHSNMFLRNKIKRIYNFDGPGLRLREFTSKKYKKIENKLYHFVPSYSVIGLLLRHNNKYKVVNSVRKDLFAHSIFTWQINDTSFLVGKLSTLSKNLDKSIILWLDKHNDIEREKIVNSIFKFLEDAGIRNVAQITKIKTLLSLYKKRNEIDIETRNILSGFIKFNYDYHKNNSLDIELI